MLSMFILLGKMIRPISFKDIVIPKHFPKNPENDCPIFWRYQLSEWKNLSDLVELIHYKLHKFGYAKISDFNILNLDISLKRKVFLGLCSHIGNPVEHNPGKRDYIWDVKLKDNIDRCPTFSEHNLKAPLHTDGQYRTKPEKYVSLLVLEKASCGGGETRILKFEHIINTLQETEDGKVCLKVLETALFPFAVPNAFNENGDKDKVIFAPIICNRKCIRYRFDTIERGLNCTNMSEKDNAIKIWALNFLRKHVENHSLTINLRLENDEILFLDNERVLHGRTEFRDSNRHILRVRMSEL